MKMTSLAALAAALAFAGAVHGEDLGSKQLHQQMMAGAKESQSMTLKGDTDADFIAMMKHHHEQGVKMAETEVAHGDDAEAKAFAQKIIENQRREIAEMEAWQKKLPAVFGLVALGVAVYGAALALLGFRPRDFSRRGAV